MALNILANEKTMKGMVKESLSGAVYIFAIK